MTAAPAAVLSLDQPLRQPGRAPPRGRGSWSPAQCPCLNDAIHRILDTASATHRDHGARKKADLDELRNSIVNTMMQTDASSSPMTAAHVAAGIRQFPCPPRRYVRPMIARCSRRAEIFSFWRLLSNAAPFERRGPSNKKTSVEV